MTEIKEGARYRVTFEGVGKSKGVRLEEHHLYPATLSNATSVEEIEPEYLPGQPYMDSSGFVWQRAYGNDGWFFPGSTRKFADDELAAQGPARPLTRLVPER